MFGLLHTLENLVQPVEVMDRFAGAVLPHGPGRMLGRCPFCDSQIWMSRHGWLCNNDACPRLVGGALDLAHRLSNTTLEEAVSRVLNVWAARFADMSMLQGSSAVAALSRAHRCRRSIVKWLRQLRNHESAEKGLVLESLRKQGIEEVDEHTFFPASPEDVKQLQALLQFLGVKTAQIPAGKTLLVVPYGCRMQEVSTLVIMDVYSKWQTRIDLQPHPVVFSGMWHLSQMCHRTFLTADPLSASALNQKLRLHGGGVALSYLSGPDFGAVTIPQLPDPVLVGNLRSRAFTLTAGRLFDLFPGLRVTMGEDKKKFTKLDYLMRLASAHINPVSGHLDEEGLTLLGLFHLDAHERGRVMDDMLARGWHGAYQQILQDRLVRELSVSDKGVLLNTPMGYAVRRKQGHVEHISNFTLQLKEAVVFESNAPFYKTSAHIGRETLDTVLSSALLDSPRELTEHLQLLAGARGSQDIPQVQDSQAFRLVSQYWRGQLAKLPVLRGTAFLGWDARFTAFYMPGCQITQDGTRYDAQPLHPSITTLDAYRTDEHASTCDPDGVPRELRTLVLLVVGCCIGFHRRVTMRPVQVYHSRNSLRVLEKLFLALGQTRPLTRLQNRVPGLQGYPAYVLATQKEQGAINEPFFLLADAGIKVLGDYTDAQLRAAAQLLRGLLVRTMEHQLSLLPDDKWERPRSVLWSNELILTAQQVLHTCGIEVDAELMSFEYTEKLFRQVPKTALPKVCKYDFAAQRVTFDIEPFKDVVDPVRLEIEMRTLAENLRVRSGYQLDMDAYSAFQIMEQYYGEVPHLT